MIPFIGFAIVVGGPATARGDDDAHGGVGRTRALAASECEGTRQCPSSVQRIGHLDGSFVDLIEGQVTIAPFSQQNVSPILLSATALPRLRQWHKTGLRAAYQAGYSVVLLDATLDDITALHQIIGDGVVSGPKDGARMLAYVLRQENDVPTTKLLTNVHRSPLRTLSGGPDLTGQKDDERAVRQAADLVVSELQRRPRGAAGAPGLRDPNQPIAWQDSPLQVTTLHQSGSTGIYTTFVNVYALHSCLGGNDHYAVTALADWTATNSRFESASTSDASLVYDRANDVYVVKEWKPDPQLTHCSSPGFFQGGADICRYINYPLEYGLEMVPSATQGNVIQLNASPAATQGQSTTYQSGFSFSIGGVVNVSAKGPMGGISAGATWQNTTATTVPPLIVEVGNTGNEGAFWNFKYCTSGLEPDAGTNCTSHVQMVRDVCVAQLGDFSGTNPQQGQTPDGKLSNAVQSGHWEASVNGRAGSTFDIEVAFRTSIGNTTANLWAPADSPPYGNDDRDAGCNYYSCACVSKTTVTPVDNTVVFKIPFPSTKCQ